MCVLYRVVQPMAPFLLRTHQSFILAPPSHSPHLSHCLTPIISLDPLTPIISPFTPIISLYPLHPDIITAPG